MPYTTIHLKLWDNVLLINSHYLVTNRFYQLIIKNAIIQNQITKPHSN